MRTLKTGLAMVMVVVLTSVARGVAHAATPTVSINQAASQADPTDMGPLVFDVLFSEPVADFATGDVSLSGSALGSGCQLVTGSGASYQVTVGGMTGPGTVSASISSGVAHNGGGEPNQASTSFDNTVLFSGTSAACPQPPPTGTAPTTATTPRKKKCKKKKHRAAAAKKCKKKRR